MKLNKWYNFLLTLLFWVFTWETYSALVEKYKLSVNQKILFIWPNAIYVSINMTPFPVQKMGKSSGPGQFPAEWDLMS